MNCENCKVSHKIQNMEKHLLECSNRIIKCNKCDTDYIFKDKSSHNCIKSLKQLVQSLQDKIKQNNCFDKKELKYVQKPMFDN